MSNTYKEKLEDIITEILFLHLAAVTLKGLAEFQNNEKKSRPLLIFIISSIKSVKIEFFGSKFALNCGGT